MRSLNFFLRLIGDFFQDKILHLEFETAGGCWLLASAIDLLILRLKLLLKPSFIEVTLNGEFPQQVIDSDNIEKMPNVKFEGHVSFRNSLYCLSASSVITQPVDVFVILLGILF